MSRARTDTARTPPEHFEALYEASPDPWDYDSSEYEREKYAATLDAVGIGPHGRVLEVGCSIGAFTQLLAPRCGELVAMDFSARAVELAQARVGQTPNVKVTQGAFPEEAPEGRWDVVVCSEVLYYLGRPAFMHAVHWLRLQLEQRTRLVAVSWRGEGTSEPLRGDWAHDRLLTELHSWHVLDGRRPDYRLDRFDGHGR
ncbi:MAG TPA: SAM-dependent methyltransferase [Solirubrobacteraceae bacterium]|jgi:cyclopropane fatty-acyl-phospholipid synthase-like methyltransferase|nr:SAM-dependent methyltransferase [Solirubrobacteraceae bacterium]